MPCLNTLLEHVPSLRNFARRFHSSPSDIDDLVQETLVKGISNAH
ncbi:sigma factor [Pararhizobium sp. DWP1-1-3]